MKRILAAILLSLSLAGCVFMPTGPTPGVDITAPAHIRAAQKAVNEADLMVIAVAQGTLDNLAAGVTTKEEAAKVRNRLRDAEKQIVRVRALIAAGDSTSELEALAVKTIIEVLQREVAQKAAK